jgi:hypothetical protein
MKGALSVMRMNSSLSSSLTAILLPLLVERRARERVLFVMAEIQARSRACARISYLSLSRNRLQNRAAHASERMFARQIARKPQPPIELLIVHFS